MYVFLFLYVHCKITYTCTRKWLSIYCTITIEHADCRYLMKHETTHTGERFKAAKCRYCGKTVNNNNIFYVFYSIWCLFLLIWQSFFSGWILQVEESWVDSHRRKAIQVSWLRLQVFFISSFREKSISCHSAERSEHEFFSNRCKFCLITWYSSCNCSQVHPEEQS